MECVNAAGSWARTSKREPPCPTGRGSVRPERSGATASARPRPAPSRVARAQRWIACACAVGSATLGSLAPVRAATPVFTGSAEEAAATLVPDHEGPLVLGEIDQVPVRITAPEPPELEPKPLRISVNVGSFDPLVRDGPGAYHTIYHLPAQHFPQVALVAVWRETGPDAPIQFLRLPLYGQAELPVKTRRGAEVTVRVGDRSFGPNAADRRGQLRMAIVVPPGVDRVRVRSTHGGASKEAWVRVHVPPYNHLTLAITPYLSPADGHSWVTVHVFYDSPDGAPPPLSRVHLRTAEGSVSPIGRDGSRYRFKFVPRWGSKASAVNLDVAVEGDATSGAQASVQLGRPSPARIVAKPGKAPVMVADGETRQTFQFLVLDRLGLGVPGVAVDAKVSSGELVAVRDLGGGEYEAVVTGPASYPAGGRADLEVSVEEGGRARVSGAIPARVLPPPWPARLAVEVSPRIPLALKDEPYAVLLTAYDGSGASIPGIQLHVSADPGHADAVEDLGGGQYRAFVFPTSASDKALLTIEDLTGHFRTEYPVALRNPPPVLTVAASLGGGYDGQLAAAARVELAARPGLFGRALALFLAVGYRQASVSFDPMQADANLPGVVEAVVRRVPITLGASIDLHSTQRFRLYVGAGLVATPFIYTLSSKFQQTETDRWVSMGGEALLGAEYRGVFLEVMGDDVPVSRFDLKAPALAGFVGLGYRLPVL